MRTNRGYIALISVILISAILLAVTLESSYVAFFSRFNTLGTEEKEESLALAQSCIQIVLLRLAENPDYRPGASGESFSLDQNNCQIISIYSDSSGNLIVKTSAFSGPAITNIEANVLLTNNSISLKSVAELSSN